MLSDVAGVEVGHWTEPEGRTGCTVIVLPQQTVASGEVRGGAPATREFALLDPLCLVQHVDAIVLSGGSAFGLATGHGAMEHLADVGRGFPTAGGPVPIVVGMSLYDLGQGPVRPGVDEGRRAAEAAAGGPHAVGRVGAGAGATVGKWGGPDAVEAGGLGAATKRSGDLVVSALIAVNAVGWIDDGATTDDPGPRYRPDADPIFGEESHTNTTIGVVVTNAIIDKAGCHLVAQSGHHGYARALHPSHTRADGDALVVAATGSCEADLDHLRVLAQHAVTDAIRSLR